jgi:hypothetical protein
VEIVSGESALIPSLRIRRIRIAHAIAISIGLVLAVIVIKVAYF